MIELTYSFVGRDIEPCQELGWLLRGWVLFRQAQRACFVREDIQEVGQARDLENLNVVLTQPAG